MPFGLDVDRVLTEKNVEVVWNDTVIDMEGNRHPDPDPGWCLSWEHGVISLGSMEIADARLAAAVFVHLWSNGIDAALAEHCAIGLVRTFTVRQIQ